jgi:MerR family transcriptional regulator/heat shock protein HspR
MSAGGDGRRMTRRVEASIDAERGVFMISVAAELAHMHPQTLRMYEARGLIEPQRSPKNTRLYSQRDVERLRRIQQMTTEQGLNLAGVETVLELEKKVERMKSELERMRKRAAELEDREGA